MHHNTVKQSVTASSELESRSVLYHYTFFVEIAQIYIYIFKKKKTCEKEHDKFTVHKSLILRLLVLAQNNILQQNGHSTAS